MHRLFGSETEWRPRYRTHDGPQRGLATAQLRPAQGGGVRRCCAAAEPASKPAAVAAAAAAAAEPAAAPTAVDPVVGRRRADGQHGDCRPRNVLRSRLWRRRSADRVVHLLGARRPRPGLHKVRRRNPHLPRLWRRGLACGQHAWHGAAGRDAEWRRRRHGRGWRGAVRRRQVCALPRRPRLDRGWGEPSAKG